MKESKKAILEVLKKNSKKNSRFDELLVNLALQKITADHFEYDDKAVFSSDYKRMIYCLYEGDRFVIPDKVEVIGQKAFYKKENLKEVLIPGSVKTIEKDAFTGCDSLERIHIPASVERIEGFAFSECSKLKTVIFDGVPKHLSRHAFEDSERLANIVVPGGTVKKFRKALHFEEEDMDYVVVDRYTAESDSADELKKKTIKANLDKAAKAEGKKGSSEKDKAEKNRKGNKKDKTDKKK
ncbi:MAG: leucine-rich repeat domain-containing protein [Prevotella sp.]|jgi:hypothetical protein|nr:leucine-rich repeat domain-containing protein [Prevotella sp.]MCH3995261.1 leucine-rich repeat domain-containing protein [Prevotella sp.]MCI1246561.1 leucine-rich repeat domain-containing protein [Prevotella sp.]